MPDHNNHNPGYVANRVFDPDRYRSIFNIKDDHSLELADSKTIEQSWSQRESHLVKELDASSHVVAHYRVWDHQSNKAPYRRQRGWEKYSLKGELLDREVRYSQEEKSITVH